MAPWLNGYAPLPLAAQPLGAEVFLHLNFINVIYRVESEIWTLNIVATRRHFTIKLILPLLNKIYIIITIFYNNILKSTSNKFITMDLETRNIDNILTPYCVSIYDGKVSISFYLLDFSSVDEMLLSSIKYIMQNKFDGYRIYLHNFSNFDGIFLIRILSKLIDKNTKIIPVIRDGKLIDLKVKFEKYILYFRDSYLLLPSSLKKLAINFNVEQKDLFPHLFVDKQEIDLNYVGKVPSIDNFYKINEEEYSNYIKQYNSDQWDLKKEVIKYCEQDCKSLYQVIETFQNIIYQEFSIDILKYPTLPSLAFAIYRSNFLKTDNKNISRIPLISGNIYNFIKQSYTGGSVDVYKPRPDCKTKIFLLWCKFFISNCNV
jgi:hypothetical protein